MYGFQNEDGRDGRRVGEGLNWFLREATVFGGVMPLFQMRGYAFIRNLSEEGC